jgi:hypothetical protein
MAHEIEVALAAIIGWGTFGSQTPGQQWIRQDVLTPPATLTGVPITDFQTWSQDDLVDYVTPGEADYCVCSYDRDDVGDSGFFDQVLATEGQIPCARWVRQKYLMLNELTLLADRPGIFDLGTGTTFGLTPRYEVYYGVDQQGSPTEANAQADYHDIQASHPVHSPPRLNEDPFQFGIGAFRVNATWGGKSNWQLYRATIQPTFDPTNGSQQNADGNHGYEFEKDIRVAVGLRAGGSEMTNEGIPFAASQYHAEVGPVDELWQISAQNSKIDALTWSIARWNVLGVPTPQPTGFPLTNVFITGLGNMGAGHWRAALELFYTVDFDKPTGFQFV